MSEEQFLDKVVEHRYVAWKLARQRVHEDRQEPVYPDPATEEIVKRIEEQEDAFKKDLLPVERYHDVLGKSLGNREHPGRVQGVGFHVRIKNAYEGIASKRTSRKAGSEAKNEERIQREVAQRVAFLTKDFVDMAERLKAEMAEQTQQLVQQQLA